MSNKKHLGLFRSYLPHLNLELCIVYFMDSLFSKEYSVKISKNFPIGLTGPQSFSLGKIHCNMFEFGALGLVSIISPSSELEIMHRFFCWIPYSLKNSLTKFENFLSTRSTGWEPAQPVRRISIKVNYWSRFEFGAPELVLVISPSSELQIVLCFFFCFLILQGTFYQFFKIFLSWLDRLASGSTGSLNQLVWSIVFGGF